MIVIGAGGFAKELIEILVSDKYNYDETNLFFFDNINDYPDDKLYHKFTILKSSDQVTEIFKSISNEYTLGIGGSKNRFQLNNKFEDIGGKLVTATSKYCSIGSFNTDIKPGTVIMDYTVLTNSVSVGKGTLINSHCLIGHEATIGDFCSIAPGVRITGNCKIGNYVNIGTGAIILPNVKVGNNSFVGAGSVISNDVPDDSMVVGVIPSRVVSKTSKFDSVED